MQFTDQQRADIERQRRENPGGRIFIEPTPEQDEENRCLIEIEEAGREANIVLVRKLDAAAAEPGFSGDLRRAINAARKTSGQLATELGVDAELLRDFRAGDAALPTDVVNRLVALLELKLVPATH